jgi:hypothetical protein
METETSYRWFPEIPARTKTFLGIKIGTTPAIQAGWNYKIDDDGNEYLRYCRRQSSYFLDYKWYRVDETTKRVYNKAHVEIRFGYKQTFGVRFESNGDAEAYVDDLISSSDKEFHVIINN